MSTYAASAMACRFDVGCGKNKAIFNASHSVNRFAPDGNRSIFKFILNLIYFFFSFLDFPLVSFSILSWLAFRVNDFRLVCGRFLTEFSLLVP